MIGRRFDTVVRQRFDFSCGSAALATLLRSLCGPDNPPWVVGDARQAIYRFRGAAPEAPQDQHHPVVVAQQAKRNADVQLRLADAITKFAGSMMFVYIHVVIFAVWMIAVESYPWPKLTLVV